MELIPGRERQILHTNIENTVVDMECNKASIAGSVSQRACVFCGSRVVLYPIADAIHLVHGPIGCAAYTWDIRGALSSGPQLHRNSFSTDLQELDVVYGGERKLEAALIELINEHHPNAAFVYSTCIVGLIGDDVNAVCRRVAAKAGIPVLPVDSEGFKGTKRDGYKAACDALFKLVGSEEAQDSAPYTINILGDFNLAGETWIIRDYLKKIGVGVTACITGDARIADIRRAHHAKLNLVQCSGSMIHLALSMQKRFGIPFKRVSFFGIEDMAAALYETVRFFGDAGLMERAQELVLRLGEGWQVTSIVNLQTGEPYSLTDGSNDISFSGEFVDRWNFSGNPNDVKWSAGASKLTYLEGSDAENDPRCAVSPNPDLGFFGCYISGSAVITPQAYGTFGNMRRNIFRGPAYANWDMSLTKLWKLTERVNLQLRGEFFNVLNHPNFDLFTMGTSLASPSDIGVVSFTPDVGLSNPVVGSGGSRHIQLGAKFIW